MATNGDRIKDRTIRQAMDDFLASLNTLHTQHTYETPLKHFATFLDGEGIDVDRAPATALNVDHAIEFVPWLRHEHFSDPDQPAKATLQLYLTAVYRLYRSLLKRGVTLEAADIARLEESYRDARDIRGEPRPKDPKLEAVEAIIQAARSIPSVRGDKAADRNHELLRLRDIAMVETLRSTGCRVGELVGMRRGDLDWMAHSALVKGKGSKYRKVYWDATAWRALKVYLQVRQDGGDARGLARLPVFCGHGNRSGSTLSPLTTRHVSRTIRSLAERAGIPEVGVTPHYFRHVFATRALDRTDNLALVQDMLGHASPATTRVYARTNEQQRQEGYARVWGEEGTFESTVPVLDAVHTMPPSPVDRPSSGGGRGEPTVFRRRGEGQAGGLLLELLRSTGCSLEELISLRRGDLDREAHIVRVTSYSESRQVKLGKEMWDALDTYLQADDVGEAAIPTLPRKLGEGEDALAPGLSPVDRLSSGSGGGGERDRPRSAKGASTAYLFHDADGTPLTVERAYELLLDYTVQVGMGEGELRRLL
jgi:site-specific recombinase XerD